MKLKKITLIVLITVYSCAAALLIAEDSKNPACPDVVKVEVMRVGGQPFQEFKTFEAKVYPQIIVVTSDVAGKVTEVRVAAGNLVSKNLRMFVINDALAKEIKYLEAQVLKWQNELQRRRSWTKRNEQSEKQAAEMIAAAEAKVGEKKIEALTYIINAPKDGRIKSVKVTKDSEINEGDVLAEIENMGLMEAEIPISAGERAMFVDGQELLVGFAESDTRLKAVISHVYPDKLVVTIENKLKEIKENYTSMFRMLKAEHKEAVILPESQLLKDVGGYFVYKVDYKYAKRANLTIGSITNGMCFIQEGLAAGDDIIISEIISDKEGTVKDKFECVGSGVRVDKYIRGVRFIKVKAAKKPGEEVVTVRRERVEVPAENYFMAGLGAGIIYVNQTDWANVYKKGNLGFGVKLAYRLQNKLEFFTEMDYMNTTGELAPTGEDTKFTNMPIYFGAKYLFSTGSKFTPFAGVAGLLDMIRENNLIEKTSKNALGFSILAGVYFDITTNLSLDLCIKYDTIKFPVEGIETKADLSGARLFLMFSYKFK
jgi:multidrug efflux pump subunit AcrA (membrane-fusion protein)/opacity protein-like surface antigen